MDFSPVSAVIAAVPFDWLIIGLTFFLFTVTTMILGPHYGATLSLALPISAFLCTQLQHTFLLGEIAAQFTSPTAQGIMFAIILLIVCVCIYRIVSGIFSPSAYPLQGVLVGFATTISLTVFWSAAPNLGVFFHFGPLITNIFGESYRLYWLIAAYLLLAFTRE